MAQNENRNMNSEVSWGRWLLEHAAGTVILGATLAGVGAMTALHKGRPIKPEMTAYAGLGTLSGLGFGRMVYTGLFGKREQPAPATNNAGATWTGKIEQERQQPPEHMR